MLAFDFVATARNRKQETTISVHFVPGMQFLVFYFGVYLDEERDAKEVARQCEGHGSHAGTPPYATSVLHNAWQMGIAIR